MVVTDKMVEAAASAFYNSKVDHDLDLAFRLTVEAALGAAPHSEARGEKRKQIAVYLAKILDDDFQAAKGFYLGHAENIMQIAEA